MTRRWRLWSFRFVVAILLPLLLLLLLEGLLRAVGYGDAPAFTVPCEAGRVCDNPRFTWRFFPPKIARTAPSLGFPVSREPSSYRIFVLGGSAAQGDPEPTYGFPRILQVLLEHRYPRMRFEVVSAAITAVNSHVVRLVARDLARHEGDLFVVYLGHNEVVGPYGPGSVFSFVSSHLALIRSSIFLRGTRLGQLVASAARGSEDPSDWRGMEFFLDRRVRFDDPRMNDVYAHLEANLESIVDAASSAGARVILSTAGANLTDSAPFASEHRADLTEAERGAWTESYRQGVEAETAGELETAEAAYRDAARIDPTFAELQFRLGRVIRAAGRHDEARARFVEARDLDALRFRADSRINRTIRAVAERRAGNNVHLLDAEKLFEASPGAELFDDHVHLSFHGNYVLASALLGELERFLPDRTPGPDLTEEQCAARLAYTRFDRRRVASLMLQRMIRPPFTNQLDHQARLPALRERSELTPEILLSASATYEAAIREAPADPWLRFNHAQLLAELGDHRAAAEELRAFLESLPHDVQGRERLAAALAEQGRFEEAVAECGVPIDRAPHLSTCYYTVAYAQANLRRFDDSIATYRELLRVDADAWDRIYNEIGRIEIHRKRFDAAIGAFEEALRRSDDRRMPDLYYNYGVALERLANKTQARDMFLKAAEEYRAELEENAESGTLHLAAGSALLEAGELDPAARHFREAARLEPANVAAHVNLVRSLEAQGERAAALEAGRQGVRALTEQGRVTEAEQLRRMLRQITASP